MVSKRLPKASVTPKPVVEMRDIFVHGAEKDLIKSLDLKNTKLEDLITKFITIDNQSALIKGLILLEARERFPSNQDYGKWLKDNELLERYSQQSLNNLVNYAAFFKNRSISGISVTVGYELSAPRNAEVATAVYREIHGKGYSLAHVKKLITRKKLEKQQVPEEVIEKFFDEMAEIEVQHAAEQELPQQSDILEGEFYTPEEKQGTLASIMPPEVKALARPEDEVVEGVINFLRGMELSPGTAVRILEKSLSKLRDTILSDLAELGTPSPVV